VFSDWDANDICLGKTAVTPLDAHASVLPEVSGSAFITGRHEFILDAGDPFRHGFLI